MFSGVYCHIGFCGDIFIRVLKSKKQRESAVGLSGALLFLCSLSGIVCMKPSRKGLTRISNGKVYKKDGITLSTIANLHKLLI